MRPTEVKYADLFCGLGAFHTAFVRCSNSKVKYTCVFACDTDKGVRGVYEENYGLAPHGDIHSLAYDELPDFDILCAGFPCQPFSIAGSRRGFADVEKGNLFYSVLDVVDAKRPDTLLLENVRNLCTIHGGSTFATIKQESCRSGATTWHTR
jgi:DNA (cytosine-5)-methyltransferase 1